MAVTGFMGTFVTEAAGTPVIAELSVETVLAFSGCYFFREAFHGGVPDTETGELRHGAAVLLTVACALSALSGVTVFGEVSIGRFLAVTLLMACAMKGGVLTGAAVGTALGAAMDIAGGGAPFFTMAYALSGMLSGVFSKHGRFVFALSFVLADAVAAVCAWSAGAGVAPLFEVFCASVVFLLLPGSLLNGVGVLLNPAQRGSGESGLRRYVARHVQSLSDAYGELYQAVRRNADDTVNDGDVSKVFDRAADAVCVGCASKNRCWNAEYQTTLAAMNDATSASTAKPPNAEISITEVSTQCGPIGSAGSLVRKASNKLSSNQRASPSPTSSAISANAHSGTAMPSKIAIGTISRRASLSHVFGSSARINPKKCIATHLVPCIRFAH